MLRTTEQRLWFLAFVGLLTVLVGCAVRRPAEYLGLADYHRHHAEVPAVTYVGGPRLDHVAHADRGLDCTDCHEVDEKTGEPAMPTFEACMECHEDIDEDKPDAEKVSKVFFDAKEAPLWRRAIGAYDEEILFGHKGHAKVGACTTCHGNMQAGEQGRRGGLLYTMNDCMTCHRKESAPNECSTCHRRLDTNVAPDSHLLTWKTRHGAAATIGRHAETQNQCGMCHDEPRQCNACHQEEMPRSHRHLWTQRHGQIVRAAGGGLPAQCAFCHTNQSFCEKCHLDEPPRNHTTLFRTRTHGVIASIDRRNCATCHRTDFCQRCHENTPPRSHRAGWSMGRNTHCVQCHFPVSMAQNCRVCHRATPTHSTAPPQPPGHIPGRDCRLCHNALGGGGARPLRHLDNGQACEACHR